jgi:hypothetical protein
MYGSPVISGKALVIPPMRKQATFNFCQVARSCRTIMHHSETTAGLPRNGSGFTALTAITAFSLVPLRLRPPDPGHRGGLTPPHVATTATVVVYPVLQPPGNSAALVSRIPALLRVSIFFRVTILTGLGTMPGTEIVEKKGKRERDTPTQAVRFSCRLRTNHGAETESEDRKFFHRTYRLTRNLPQPDKKRKDGVRPGRRTGPEGFEPSIRQPPDYEPEGGFKPIMR